MTLTVRPVTSADAPELAELLNAIIARGGTTALDTPEHIQEVIHGKPGGRILHLSPRQGAVVGEHQQLANDLGLKVPTF